MEIGPRDRTCCSPLTAQILQGAPAGEVEAPPAASCAPTGSEGVAGGAWDAPLPKVSPNCTHCPPEPQQRQLDATAIPSWM